MKKRYKQRKNHWNNSYKYYMDKTIFFCWVSAPCSCYIFRRFGAAYRLPLQSEWTGLCGCWIDTEETFVAYVGRFQVVSPIRAAEGGESGRDCASVTHTATATLCICHAHSNKNVLFKVQTQRRLHRRTHQTLYEVIPNIQTCVYCPKLFCWRVWKLQTFVITKDCRIETADKSYFRLIYVSPTIAITSP